MRQQWPTAFRFAKLRFREWLEFDSPLLKQFAGYCAFVFAFLCLATRQTRTAFLLFAKIHSSACSSGATRFMQSIIRSAVNARTKDNSYYSVRKLFREHSAHLSPTALTQKFFDDPKKMLRSMAIVLKSPSPNEKGAICILYSYALPLLARLFDIERITEKYFLVLEPSWSGYCNLDILCYSQLACPVFVQAYEPRDQDFILDLHSNFVPIPISNNWWVDHRIFTPIPSVAKDADIVMVAGWADFKRHHRFFQSLKKLRAQKANLKVILIGYPMGRTKTDIRLAAEYYGVSGQLETYEWITQQEVNALLNRSKVNVIWSRREGVNRAIIEGMFAGVPCILREGFNYGFPYPYINSATGCYSSEEDLPEKLLWMIENYRQFSPREWVMKHISCQRATESLSETIRDRALKSGETWTRDLVVKVNGLHGMSYWDDTDRQNFEADYQFLAASIRYPGKDAGGNPVAANSPVPAAPTCAAS